MSTIFQLKKKGGMLCCCSFMTSLNQSTTHLYGVQLKNWISVSKFRKKSNCVSPSATFILLYGILEDSFGNVQFLPYGLALEPNH